MGSRLAPPGRGEHSRTVDHPHYGRMAICLHWGLGVLLIAQIAFGFLLDDIAPRGTPLRAPVINLHKSVGIVLGLLTLVRLAWTLGHAAPQWPATMHRWQRHAAVWAHGLLYACMLVVPLSGYIASNFSRFGVNFFGLALPPWGADLPPVYDFFNRLHVGTTWLFAVLTAGHVAVALKHALVDRDGVFSRMLP